MDSTSTYQLVLRFLWCRITCSNHRNPSINLRTNQPKLELFLRWLVGIFQCSIQSWLFLLVSCSYPLLLFLIMQFEELLWHLMKYILGLFPCKIQHLHQRQIIKLERFLFIFLRNQLNCFQRFVMKLVFINPKFVFQQLEWVYHLTISCFFWQYPCKRLDHLHIILVSI